MMFAVPMSEPNECLCVRRAARVQTPGLGTCYERIVFLYFRLFLIPNSQRYQTAGAQAAADQHRRRGMQRHLNFE